MDFKQPGGRVRFIQAHELGHSIIPWHQASFYLDDEQRLSRDAEDYLEQEANLAAALLLFQGMRFHAVALEHEHSIKTPISLASTVGASIHATIHHYVELHPESVAVAVIGQLRRPDGRVPVLRTVESPSFRQRFGSLMDHIPGGTLSLDQTDGHIPFAALAAAARSAVEPPSDTVGLMDLGRRAHQFKAEVFFNQRCFFMMLTPKTAIRQGRRVFLAPSNARGS